MRGEESFRGRLLREESREEKFFWFGVGEKVFLERLPERRGN